MNIHLLKPAEISAWDEYVYSHSRANAYHLSGWKNIIAKAYAHPAYYLAASPSPQNKSNAPSTGGVDKTELAPNQTIAGILPLIHLKHPLFGNSLTSIPFFDIGGILADNAETEKALLAEAINIGRALKSDLLEIRQASPLPTTSPDSLPAAVEDLQMQTSTHKHRMVLQLPASSETLMQSFKSKLRSQIKKPLREGLTHKWGGLELLEDFYNVFLINMRDLGSPVHSKKIIKYTLEEFPEAAKIIVVYSEDKPVAGAVILGFKNMVCNPWASSLREYSRLSPNMLLYWRMLEFACDQGFSFFDFGRSSPDEGTYKFKAQWGAKPEPLHWHYLSWEKKHDGKLEGLDKSRYQTMVNCWQRLPVCMTKTLGPAIRKYISL